MTVASHTREQVVALLGRLRQTPFTVLFAALAIAIFLFDAVTPILEIQFQEPGGVGLLQVFGCHLLHWSPSHLFWDLGMFLALGLLCETRMPARFLGAFVGTAVVVPLAVMMSQPEIAAYRGLSGIDTALFSLFAMRNFMEGTKTADRWQCAIHAGLLLLLVGKTGFELFTGSTLFVRDDDFMPLPVAHLVGIVVGSMAAVAGRPWATCRMKSPVSVGNGASAQPSVFGPRTGNVDSALLLSGPEDLG